MIPSVVAVSLSDEHTFSKYNQASIKERDPDAPDQLERLRIIFILFILSILPTMSKRGTTGCRRGAYAWSGADMAV